MNVETVLTTVLASSASASVVVFLSKSVLKLWLDKDLETHRANLARQSTEEVERLRAQLAQIAVEHEVRFKRMHDKRTWVIAGIFAHLETLHATLRSWYYSHGVVDDLTAELEGKVEGPLPDLKAFTRPEFEKRAREASEQLQAFYFPRAIWLERDLCNLLNELVQALDILLHVLDTEARGVTVEGEGDAKTRELATDLLRRVVEARTALESKFRGILGISNE